MIGNFRNLVTGGWTFRSSRCRRAICLVLALIFLLTAGGSPARGSEKEKLPTRYREWLEKDVVYIITKEERNAFLEMKGDEERDKFIERFWEIRNPTPGAPTNPYKEEHYRRLEYANQYFGKESGTDGWRTDRGRVYITLGPPQQKALYLGYQKLRPMEIWFYSFSHPALPPFFYVLFYQRDNIADFRLYSPYMDGPQKLVTTTTESNRLGSLKVIEQQAGREVARVSLSLVPDEPVDWETARSSLQSDVMLAAIRNLANHPLSKLDLDRRRELMESVSHRIIFEGESLEALTVPLRDADGNINLHYLLRLKKPEDLALAQSNDGRYYYSLEVTARVFGADKKLIFTQDRTLSRYVDKNEFEQIKSKVFSYEGWLPLPPGKYKLEFLLTNSLKHTAFRIEKEVAVPELPAEGMRLTELVPFSAARAVDPGHSTVLPFSAPGLKFTPMLGRDTQLVPGQDLNVFYQIWAPARDPRLYHGKKLLAEYAYGRPGARGESKVIRDEVLKDQFDPFGSLLNGKKIPLSDLPAGNYLLTLTLTDPETQQRAYGTLPFRISSFESPPAAWNVYDEAAAHDMRQGTLDYQRGLCYLAIGNKERALEWFQKALQKNPALEEARARLVDVYFSRQAYRDVVELYSRGGITSHTEERTILWMAESLDKVGETKKATQVLESALKLRTPSGPLLLALASYYERLGDAQKAAGFTRQAEALLMNQSPGKP